MTTKKKTVQKRRHAIMVYLPLDVKAEADRQAQAEGRSVSNYCAFLVRTGLASGLLKSVKGVTKS